MRKYTGSFDLSEMQEFIQKSLSLDDQFQDNTVGAVPTWMPPVSPNAELWLVS